MHFFLEEKRKLGAMSDIWLYPTIAYMCLYFGTGNGELSCELFL
jgi:hypothetical protein